MTVPEKRQMSGVFYRIMRENKWERVDFTDMTPLEMFVVLSNMTHTEVCNLSKILADRLRTIGDQFGIKLELGDGDSEVN